MKNRDRVGLYLRITKTDGSRYFARPHPTRDHYILLDDGTSKLAKEGVYYRPGWPGQVA